MAANPSRQRVLPGLALAQTAKRKLTCPGDVGAFFINENGPSFGPEPSATTARINEGECAILYGTEW